MSCNSSTCMPSLASLHDEGSEVVGSDVQNDDDSSLSQASEAPDADASSYSNSDERKRLMLFQGRYVVRDDAAALAPGKAPAKAASTLQTQMLGSAQANKAPIAKAASTLRKQMLGSAQASKAKAAVLADTSTKVDPGSDSSAPRSCKTSMPTPSSKARVAKAASLADTSTTVDPGSDSSAPRSSKTSMPTSSFKVPCTMCGDRTSQGRRNGRPRISECKICNGAADFPSLGVAGQRSVVPQAQVSVNQFDERQRRQVAQTVAAEAEKTLKRDIQNKADESRAAATAAAKENQFKCHYCQEKGHWLRDCPKKTADVKQAARQRAQEARDRAERERQREEEARQRPQASQATGYGHPVRLRWSASESTFRRSPLSGCPRSCRICYPTG